jgi:protein arginine kinase activator
MECEHCHQQNATVFMTQLINGKKVEMHLCKRCAKEIQGKMYNDDSFHQFLASLLQLQGDDFSVSSNVQEICPQCGMSLEEFKKKSKLGCNECYQVFRPYIKHIIKSVQGGHLHTGKKPLRLNKKVALSDKIQELESSLNLALMQEDYHEAARIRDLLLGLRGEGNE